MDLCLQEFLGWLSKNCDENPRMRALLVGENVAHARILVAIFGQPTYLLRFYTPFHFTLNTAFYVYGKASSFQVKN